mgnify:CR=1 FL=1
METNASQEEWWKDLEPFGEKEDFDDQREGGQHLFCLHCNHLQHCNNVVLKLRCHATK